MTDFPKFKKEIRTNFNNQLSFIGYTHFGYNGYYGPRRENLLNVFRPFCSHRFEFWKRKNLKRNINYKLLKSNICYGSHRHDFLFASDLNKNKNYKKYNSKNLAGYFQLYKYDKSKLYKRSFYCSYVDYDFLNNFDDTEFLKVAVKHLGLPGVNWEGKSCDTFIDDLNNILDSDNI